MSNPEEDRKEVMRISKKIFTRCIIFLFAFWFVIKIFWPFMGYYNETMVRILSFVIWGNIIPVIITGVTMVCLKLRYKNN